MGELKTATVSYLWPAAHGPVWIPMRSLSVSSGRWRIVKRDTWSSRSRAILQIFKLCKAKDALQPLSHRPIGLKVSNNAILQISTMCRPSLGFGNPLTTMYASPIVSIWQQNILRCLSDGHNVTDTRYFYAPVAVEELPLSALATPTLRKKEPILRLN